MQRTILKLLSAVLTLALLLSSSQALLAVAASEIASSSSQTVTAEPEETLELGTVEEDVSPYTESAYIVGEEKSLRKENEKHFRLSDGSYIAAVYPEPVHFSDNGEWVDIDNTLVATESGYKNKANGFSVDFKTGAGTNELFTLSKGEYSVKLSLASDTAAKASLYSLRNTKRTVEIVSDDDVTEAFDVKSAASAAEEYKYENPEATAEQIEAVVKAQNEENLRQQNFVLQARNTDSSIRYTDILGSTDIGYVVTPASVKENIILEDANAGNVFAFVLDTELSAHLKSDGSVELCDGDDVIFTLPAPYMYDADGERSDGVAYSLGTKNGKTTLTVTADEEWLKDDGRAYPVTVDPTVSSGKTNDSDTNISTAYYSSGEDETVEGTDVLPVGYDADLEYVYGYMKVNSLPSIPINSKLNSAQIALYLYGANSVTVTSGGVSTVVGGYVPHGTQSFNLSVKEALDEWYEQFDGTEDGNDSIILDRQTVSADDMGSFVTFDVTSAAEKWYANASSNTGLVFFPTLTNEQLMNPSYYATAYFRGYNNSAEKQDGSGSVSGRPFFVVTYRNYNGTESYLTYQSASAGRAGNVSVSHYTGYVNIVRPLVAGTGFTLSYVYNSPYSDRYFTKDVVYNTVDYTNMLSHRGWRLNVQQSIVEKTLSYYSGSAMTSQTYYVYSDADGTEHYFRHNSETDKYEDEDGMNLTVEKSGATYTMSDEKGNRKIFRNGYLSEIIDTKGNKVVLLYGTLDYAENSTAWHPAANGAQLRRIIYVSDTDKTNPITVATLNYDTTTKLLTSVTDRAGRATSFGTGDGYLTILDDPEGEGARYTYTPWPNRIKAAYDTETDYGITIVYDTETVLCASMIGDFTASDLYNDDTWTVYNVVYTRPEGKTTLYRHTGGDKTSWTYDDVVTTYVFDTYGRTVTVRSEDNNGKTLGASGGTYTANKDTEATNNKLLKTASTGAVSQDMLYDSGFDKNTQWFVSRANETNYEAYIATNQYHTGGKSYILRSLAYDGWIGIYCDSAITSAGTYTLSAYVKSTTMYVGDSDSAGFAAYIRLPDDTPLAESRTLTTVTAEEIDGGWTKLSCTYTAAAPVVVRLSFGFTDATGTVYVDDVQFEKNDAASPYNLLEDGEFNMPMSTYWTTAMYAATENVTQYDGTSGKALCLEGRSGIGSYAAQMAEIMLPGTETYMLSGWAKADSLPITDTSERSFGLSAIIYYTDGTSETHEAAFSYSTHGDWQYLATPVIPEHPEKTVQGIAVGCDYADNANKAYFDGIALIREYAQAYSYDEEGNVIAVNKTNTDELNSLYENGNLIQSTGSASGTYEYEYDDEDNLVKATNDGVEMSLTYDEAGNALSTTLSGTDGKYMTTSATYTDSGTKVETVTDNLGNTSTSGYDTARGLLTLATAPLSDSYSGNPDTQSVIYSYTASDRLDCAYIASTVALNYTYSKGQVTEILRGGFKTSGGSRIDQSYYFTYNDYGQTTSTAVGDYTLSENTYDSANRLSGTTYGNGDSVSYTYDYLDRLESAVYNDIDVKVTYTYDYLSALVCSEVTNIAGTTELATYNYEYDSLGRLVRFYETLGSRVKQQSECSYDSKNRISSYDWYDGAEMHSVTYTYNEENGGLLEKYDYGEDGAIGLRYDALNRMNIRYQRHSTAASDFWGTYYTYQNGESSAQTTSLVSQIKHQFSADDPDDSYTLDYTYDNLGNITEVKANGEVIADYVYNKQGQLWLEGVYPENGSNYTLLYNYDTYGNIKDIRKYQGAGLTDPGIVYGFSTFIDSVEYTYGDSEWPDKLTAYDGVQFTYDEIGNPLTYYNGNDYEFTWEAGRQLASVKINDDEELRFEYNADGIRVQKSMVNWFNEYYRLDGDKVVEITRNGFQVNSRCVITYDESGKPFSFEYYSSATDTTPDKYYYVFNLQGDVIQLRTADGTIVANYVYDAWGKPVSVTGNPDIAQINPLRYRGYFYDTETGLYYCNSRYYDPEVKRWINADGYITTGQGFISYNMYSYCLNNPVMYYDTTGTKPGVNNTYVCSDGGSMSAKKACNYDEQNIGGGSNITSKDDTTVASKMATAVIDCVKETVSVLTNVADAYAGASELYLGGGYGIGCEIDVGGAAAEALLVADIAGVKIDANSISAVTALEASVRTKVWGSDFGPQYVELGDYTQSVFYQNNWLKPMDWWDVGKFEIGGAAYFIIGVRVSYTFDLNVFYERLYN